MNNLSLNNLGVSGENTTYGIITVQDHDYVVTVRCQVEHHIVVFIVAGATLENAHKAMMLFQQAWAPAIAIVPPAYTACEQSTSRRGRRLLSGRPSSETPTNPISNPLLLSALAAPAARTPLTSP